MKARTTGDGTVVWWRPRRYVDKGALMEEIPPGPASAVVLSPLLWYGAGRRERSADRTVTHGCSVLQQLLHSTERHAQHHCGVAETQPVGLH